ncbi:MAG: ABC transporter substrate-binding protein, partial [Rhizobium altiplani]
IAYNPNNSDEAKLTNFQGWRTSFFDEKLNSMIDAAQVEADKTAQTKLYGDIQAYYADLVPAIQPFSEVVDTVGVRADIKGLTLNPSWSTQLRTVTKER